MIQSLRYKKQIKEARAGKFNTTLRSKVLKFLKDAERSDIEIQKLSNVTVNWIVDVGKTDLEFEFSCDADSYEISVKDGKGEKVETWVPVESVAELTDDLNDTLTFIDEFKNSLNTKPVATTESKKITKRSLKENGLFRKGQVFEGRKGSLRITKQVSSDTYLVSYQDFLLSSLSFTDWTFEESELKEAIQKVQSGEQLVWDHFQEKRSSKESRNLKERVLDYDTWDKYYDKGAEAYFERKTLSEVPITGNAWFREAWEEGWKNAKACDDEDARRAEAEYDDD